MSRSLVDIQRMFAQQLLADTPPSGRMGIYFNNRRANFRKALALDYPVIERIVGPEFFDQLAFRYLAKHPSHSGDLHHVGRDFAFFLAKDFAVAGSGYEYLVELAQLERLWAEALIAAEVTPLGVEILGRFSATEIPTLQFALHPAVGIVESVWPVHTLFLEHRKAEPNLVHLDAGGECVAVVRCSGVVEAHRLELAECRFWQALRRSESLAAAVDAAALARPALDLGAVLGRLFALGVVVGVSPSA